MDEDLDIRPPGPQKLRTIAQEFVTTHDREVDNLYEEKLTQTREEEARVIRLNQIPPDERENRTKQLEAKLQSLTTKLQNEIRDGRAFSDLSGFLHSLYMRDVLRLVLKHGEVNTWAYSRAVSEKLNASLTPEIFDSACLVVEDYVTTGGQNVSVGPLPPPK